MRRVSRAEAILAATVLVHLGVSVLHGIAHTRAHVALSPASLLFVVSVIVIGPIAGVVVQRTALPRTGAWVTAAALGGALGFGLINHFLIPGADHVSHVAEPQGILFGVTALLLAGTEAFGSGVAVWCVATAGRRSS